MRILLVEDNEGDILLTQEALMESNPATVIHIVRDGEAALDFMFKRGDYQEAVLPDIILLDINLPKRNGHEVLQEIRASPNLSAIPVIILTTSSAKQDVQRAYRTGANTYVVKDFVFEDLSFKVEKLEHFWRNVALLPN